MTTQELRDPASKMRTVGADALNTILEPVKKRIGIIKIETFVPESIQTDMSFEDVDQLLKYYTSRRGYCCHKSDIFIWKIFKRGSRICNYFFFSTT